MARDPATIASVVAEAEKAAAALKESNPELLEKTGTVKEKLFKVRCRSRVAAAHRRCARPPPRPRGVPVGAAWLPRFIAVNERALPAALRSAYREPPVTHSRTRRVSTSQPLPPPRPRCSSHHTALATERDRTALACRSHRHLTRPLPSVAGAQEATEDDRTHRRGRPADQFGNAWRL